MSSFGVLDRSTKTSRMLVTFAWGASGIRRYTDWTSPVSFLGERFESVPSMEIGWPENSGALKEKPFTITLPLDLFTTRISSGEPHQIIRVAVREYVIGEQDSSADIIFNGYAARAKRSADAQSGTVRIECSNIKQRFNIPLGLMITGFCQHTFGEDGCDSFRKVALTETRQVVAIDRNRITLEALNAITPWRRGYVELDELRIGIRDYDTLIDPNQLVLVRDAPTSWLGQDVDCVPGCMKDIDACRAHLNEERFLGAGIAIPSYHPVIETQ